MAGRPGGPRVVRRHGVRKSRREPLGLANPPISVLLLLQFSEEASSRPPVLVDVAVSWGVGVVSSGSTLNKGMLKHRNYCSWKAICEHKIT